tara:strand:+ start:640 stop:894 length:255 start_codon:yes stop_codon:yes gene_type:complete
MIDDNVIKQENERLAKEVGFLIKFGEIKMAMLKIAFSGLKVISQEQGNNVATITLENMLKCLPKEFEDDIMKQIIEIDKSADQD